MGHPRTTTAHLSSLWAATKLARASRRRTQAMPSSRPRRWPDPVGVDEPTTPVPTWPTPSRPAPLWRSSSRSLVVTGAVSDAAAAAGPTQVAWSVHGAVNVTIWSIDSDGAGFQAILSAAIGDYGAAVTVFPDGKVDAHYTSGWRSSFGTGRSAYTSTRSRGSSGLKLPTSRLTRRRARTTSASPPPCRSRHHGCPTGHSNHYRPPNSREHVWSEPPIEAIYRGLPDLALA